MTCGSPCTVPEHKREGSAISGTFAPVAKKKCPVLLLICVCTYMSYMPGLLNGSFHTGLKRLYRMSSLSRSVFSTGETLLYVKVTEVKTVFRYICAYTYVKLSKATPEVSMDRVNKGGAPLIFVISDRCGLVCFPCESSILVPAERRTPIVVLSSCGIFFSHFKELLWEVIASDMNDRVRHQVTPQQKRLSLYSPFIQCTQQGRGQCATHLFGRPGAHGAASEGPDEERGRIGGNPGRLLIHVPLGARPGPVHGSAVAVQPPLLVMWQEPVVVVVACERRDVRLCPGSGALTSVPVAKVTPRQRSIVTWPGGWVRT